MLDFPFLQRHSKGLTCCEIHAASYLFEGLLRHSFSQLYWENTCKDHGHQEEEDLCVSVWSLCRKTTEILIAFSSASHWLCRLCIRSLFPKHVGRISFICFNTKWLVEWPVLSQRSQNSLHQSRERRAVRQFTIQAIVEEGNLKRYSGSRKGKAEAVIERLEMSELMWQCWFSSAGLHGG